MKGTLRLLATSFTIGLFTLLGGKAQAQCPVVIVDVTATNVTCNGANDGTICITVTGGFPNYTYQIFNGPFFQNFVTSSTSHCFTGLGAGVTQYLVQVIAENGVGGSCGNPPSLFITITDPPAIAINVSTTPETCPDSNDGTATANVIGGVGPFNFSWLPLPDITQTVTGLDGGPYSVTVTDANSCTATENFTITSPPDWDGTFTPTDVSCNGGSDGEITSSGVTGATPPYTFLWNPSGLTTENISGIPAGSYTLTVTDNLGCTQDFGPTVVNEPTPIVITSVVTNVSCAGASDGAVNITVSGGTGPYTFSWDNGPITEDITGLPTGSYTVTVTDANGCTETHTATVNNPTPILANATVVNATCNAVCNGSITLAPTGGTGPYTFAWSPNVSSGASATNLCAGTYDITITDALGCSVVASEVVTDNQITVTFNTTEPLCNGDCNGSITAVVNGPNPPFTLLWTPGGLTGATISNLCAGNYTLDITDGIGCTTTQQVTLTEPDPIVISFAVTDVTCNGGSDGAIDLTVNGGTPPYSYSWTPNGATTEDLANIPAGTYTVDVTDVNGCTVQGSVIGGNFGGGALALPDGSGVSYTTAINITGFPGGSTIAAATDVQTVCINMEHSYLGDLQISLTCPSGQSVVLKPYPGGTGTYLGGANDTGTGVPGTPAQYCFAENAPFGTILAENTLGNWVQAGNPLGNSMTPGTYTPSSSFNGFVGCTMNGNWTLTVTDNLAIDDGFIFDWSINLAVSGSVTSTTTVNEPAPIVGNPTVVNSACGQCNGSITVAPSGGTGPYTFLWATGETTASLSNLCAGVYQVDITDANGCTETVLVPVSNTDGPTGATVNATNATCFGQCNGSATLTPIGGTAPYTFNWVPGGFTTATVNNLCADTYLVQIQDANGCIFTQSVVITEPAEILVSQTVTASNCGLCDGTATLTPSGAAGPFTFAWSPNVSVTNSASNLCPNSYDVTVTAANGCSIVATVVVNDAPAATLAITSTPITCNAGCDGSATVTITGGNAPFSVLWNDPAAQTTLTATNLCAGTYTVQVTDASGCVSVQTVTIAEPTPVTLSIAIIIDETCLGNCNGLVSVVPSGGTVPFTFLWNDPAAQTTATASGLCPGTYNVVVTDANGCVNNVSATVGAGATVTATATSTNVTCNGLCNGTGTVTPAGGTAPFTFVWDDPLGQTTQTATNLCPGTYNVTVTDANGCQATASVTITQPNNFTLNRTSTPATCGQCDGTGTVTVSGGAGQGPFTFLWSTGQTTGAVTGLCAGVYTVTVTNAAGCSNSINVIVSSTDGPTAVPVNVTNVTCFGQCNGAVTANPQGGTAPYTYVWIPGGQTTQTVTGLCAGQYQLQVTDANGCSFSRNVNVEGPSEILPNQTVVPATCGQCNGSISLAPTGGTGPYTFSWNNGASTQNLTNLCAGQYTVTITDANGCTRVQTFGVGSEGGPNVTVTSNNSSCANPCSGNATLSITGTAPFAILWSNGQSGVSATGLCAGTYTATVTDGNGCVTSVQAVITQPVGIVFTSATTADNLCPGTCTGTASVVASGGTLPIAYTWSPNVGSGPNVTGLCVGSYTVTATDANGCTTTQTVTISDPQPLVVTITPTQPTCSGTCNGEATATVTGGTAPYTFLWDDSSAQTTQTATGLCAGTFTVTVTDANGCTETQTIVLGQPQSVTGTTTLVNVSCNGNCNGSATVVASGGTPGYTFLWNDPANQSTATAINLCPGTYSVQITDANGCVGSVNATIGEPTPIVVNSTSVSADCGVCNGSATATVSGGVAPYSIVWSNGQTTPSVNGLCAGVFSVEVTDANGCVNLTNVAVNNIGGATSATVNNTPESCFGECDGTASVSNPIGGTAPYTFLWVPGGQTTASVSNVCAGSYFAQIIDADGCIFNQPVTVGGPSEILANAVSTSTPCGVCNGSITIAPSGGVGPYTVSWSNGATGLSLTNLCAGAYTVTITDATGCSNTIVVPVNSITGPTVNITGVNPTCSTNCNGSVSVAISGATPPYTVAWQPGGQTGTTLNNVCPGTYTAVVSDAVGCVTVATTTITGPAPLSLSTSFIQDVACGGQCTGTATVVASGGNLPYTFAWSSGAGNQATATNLCAGTYTVTVTDASGCTQTTTVVIDQPVTITVNVAQTNPSCAGLCDGSATASASGGTAPYTFQWNLPGNPTTPTVNSLCAGTYTVTVTDANNCQQTQTVTITEPPVISISLNAQNVTCNGACDGSITANISGGNGGPYTVIWNDPAGQTTANASGLCPGTYTITVTDGNGCSNSAQATITQPAPLNVSATSAPASCGECNGSAAVTVNGGTAPYTFLWSNGATIGSVSNLCAGVYTVLVTDANGCSQQVNVAVSNTGGATSATVNATPSTCFGACNGSATVTPVGGQAPYTYLWVPGGQTTQSVSNLCAGTYNVQIVDANGCIFTQAVVITQPTQIQANSVSTPATCGACDGSLSISPSGGTGPYSVTWSNGGSGNSLTNLCAGVYTATITDASGCSITEAITINSTNGPVVTVTTTAANCFGACTGTATANVTGAGGPFTISWTTPGNPSGTQVSGLCAGDYAVSVTNASGCVTVVPFSISQPAPFALSTTFTQNILCAGDCNGVATAIPSGGTLPYTFAWTPSGGNQQSATGLCAGTYTVNVADASGCSLSNTVTITEPTPLVATVSATPASCGGVCDGSATVSISGGTAPYSILWANGQTTATVNGLCAGPYSVTVTDANGCTQVVNIVVTEPPVLNAAITATSDVLCVGACTGSATVTGSGGTPGYTYTWSNGQNGQTATNLCVGQYTVTITDAIGCTATATAVIQDGQALNASVSNSTNVTCFGACDGTATASATGGIGPYFYQWNDPNSQTTQTAIGLCPGTYTVTVTDSQVPACTFQATVTITQPALLTATAVGNDVSCGNLCDGTATAFPQGGTAPYTYAWNFAGQSGQTATDLCVGNYTVTITDANGCSTQANVSIGGPPAIVSNATTVASTCSNIANGSLDLTVAGGVGAYTFNWQPGGLNTEDLTNVLSGVYTVVITDATGCSITATYTIGTLIQIDANAGPDVTVCQNTPIVLQGSGGGIYLWSPSIGLSDVNVANPTAIPTDTLGTTYTLTVTIGNCTATDNVTITALPVPVVDAGADVTIPQGGSVALNSNGIVTPWDYDWSPTSWLNDPNISNPVATPQESITYIVTVTDANGCSSTDSIRIEVVPGIVFPDGITPNGDGINDTWTIDNIYFFPDAIVEVYNRWGQMLFQSAPGYPVPWDGRYNGNDLPVGTYYFVIHSSLFKDAYTGPITIVR